MLVRGLAEALVADGPQLPVSGLPAGRTRAEAILTASVSRA